MDFPKKQAQRLMPLYLLEYSEKLFENHPNPEDPWGGGGSDYTAGDGIDITNDVISVDNTIARKSDIPSLTGYATEQWVLDKGYITSTDLLGYATETWVQNQGYLTSSALIPYVTTTQLEDALDDYALKTDLPENVSDLNNDAGYTTQTWVENQGYLTSTDLSNYVTSSDLSSALSDYALSSTVTGIASQVTTLESLVSNHTTQINSINSNITDLQTLTSTHTSQISGINSSITSLESLVNTNTSNISTIQNSINNMTNHPFYRVEDENQFMFFDWNGTDPFYKYYFLSQPAYVRLNALNPNYSNGLIASYNSNTRALDVSLDWNVIPSINPNVPLSPVQTLSTLQVDGVVYGIPSGGASYSAGTGIDITNNEISIDNTVALKSELFSGNYNDLTNKPTIPSTATTTVTASSETLTFTYSDNTTASFTFLTAITSATTTLS